MRTSYFITIRIILNPRDWKIWFALNPANRGPRGLGFSFLILSVMFDWRLPYFRMTDEEVEQMNGSMSGVSNVITNSEPDLPPDGFM